MPRKYKPTGGKPGARKGNANAVTHGAYSQIERAETLRAHSAMRGAKALDEARRLEAAEASMAARIEADAEQTERDDSWREMFNRARTQPNFRGLMVNVMRVRIATEWLWLFPGEAAPEWVYEWLDAMPNVHTSAAFEDDDDIVAGLPHESGPQHLGEEEEGGGGENPETTPPPVHPRSLWNELFPGVHFGSVATIDDRVVDRLFELCPQFASRIHAEAYLKWKMRQFAAHGAGPYSKPLTVPHEGFREPVRRSPLEPWSRTPGAAD